MIPKRIIQTHRDRESLQPLHRECQEELRRHHPDYEYLFFSDCECRDFIRQRHPEFLELWDFYPRGVQRADFFRILAVYHLGGFYFDLDVYFHEPVDELLSTTLVFPQEWEMPRGYYSARHREEPQTGEDLKQLGNYALGAEAGHWFFREILEEMIARTGEVDMQELSNDDVLYSTGPDMLNAVVRRHRERLGGELTILTGELNPRPPFKQFDWGGPAAAQFGRYANHLMTSVWK